MLIRALGDALQRMKVYRRISNRFVRLWMNSEKKSAIRTISGLSLVFMLAQSTS